jgi:PAS domain S-box-containing protein
MEGRKEQLSKTIQIKISDLALSMPHAPEVSAGMPEEIRLPAVELGKYGISINCVYDAVFVTDELGTIIDVNGKASELFLHSGDDLRFAVELGKYGISINCVYDAVLVTDELGTIIDVNGKASELFLHSGDDLRFKNIRELVLGFDSPVMFQVVQNVRNGKRVLVEAFCLRKDDSTFPAETAVTRVTMGLEQNLLCFFIRNVTHHKQAEEAMRMAQTRMARAERLEAAGMVAGQIAHDFNNLLTPLLGYPALIRRLLPKDSPILEFVGIMETTAQDMAHLTEQLLCLSRRGRLGQDEKFSMNDVVKQAMALLRTDTAPGIRVELNLDPDLMQVKGGRDQVGRVIHNLCRNAIDAMGESGSLTITSENVYLETPLRSNSDVKPGEYVRISVKDSGHGIPDEVKDKMFDPFFTTKRANKRRGSGLGLSIVMGIVKDHNGYIDFTTQLGKGTVFFVYLPIFRDEQRRETDFPGGRETILLMDDDVLQVELIAQMLSSLGYRVVGCRSGEEAVLLFKKGKVQPDLAILDVLIPGGMDGGETMHRLRSMKPHLPVILISGMPAGAEMALQLGEAPFLRKPITLEHLSQEVRKALDQHRKTGGKEGGGKSILIVDDEEPMRKLFSLILQSEYPDVRIEQAGNGREAIAAAIASRPRVIIMDCQMPVLDGTQAFNTIQAEFEKRDWSMPSVMFCTGFTLPDALRKVVAEDHHHAYLPKPIQAETLIEEVGIRLK